MSERNIRLLVEYDGTRYCGWQVQEAQLSVQGELQAALKKIISAEPQLIVAGRTDAGVHALAQVVNFRTTSTIEARRFAPALNTHLPDDITVHVSDEVPVDFHARFSAEGKRYRYRVYQARQPAAMDLTRSWHVKQPLDLDAMRTAAAHLVGPHDYEAFRSAQCDAPHARREIYAVPITETPRPPVGRFIDIEFYGDAFCRHQCRIMAGALVAVGMGKMSPNWIAEVLESRDRTKGGMTAPPGGLTLLEVLYTPRT